MSLFVGRRSSLDIDAEFRRVYASAGPTPLGLAQLVQAAQPQPLPQLGTVVGSGVNKLSQIIQPPAASSFSQLYDPAYVGPGVQLTILFQALPLQETLIPDFAGFIANIVDTAIRSKGLKTYSISITGRAIPFSAMALPRGAPPNRGLSQTTRINEYTIVAQAHDSPVSLILAGLVALVIISALFVYALVIVSHDEVLKQLGNPPIMTAPKKDAAGNLVCDPGLQLSVDKKSCISLPGNPAITAFCGTDAMGKPVCCTGFVALADGSGCISQQAATGGGPPTPGCAPNDFFCQLSQQGASLVKTVGLLALIAVGGYAAFKIAQRVGR